MSKIVTAINVMVSNPDRITDVVKGRHETECFFKYENKHHWSILETNDKHFFLSYYPDQPNLRDLANIPDEEWEEFAPRAVTYNTKVLAVKEAVDSFRELFLIVNEKNYGMDDVLNEIISGDTPF